MFLYYKLYSLKRQLIQNLEGIVDNFSIADGVFNLSKKPFSYKWRIRRFGGKFCYSPKLIGIENNYISISSRGKTAFIQTIKPGRIQAHFLYELQQG